MESEKILMQKDKIQMALELIKEYNILQDKKYELMRNLDLVPGKNVTTELSNIAKTITKEKNKIFLKLDLNNLMICDSQSADVAIVTLENFIKVYMLDMNEIKY